MSFDSFGLDASSREKQLYGSIMRCAGNDVLVGGEGETVDFFGVTVESEIAFGVIDVPEIDIIL